MKAAPKATTNQFQQKTAAHSAAQPQHKIPPKITDMNPEAIIQRVSLNPDSLSRSDVMQLQRTIGNRAVGRLMKSIQDGTIQQKPAQSLTRQLYQPEIHRLQSTVQREMDQESSTTANEVGEAGDSINDFSELIKLLEDSREEFIKTSAKVVPITDYDLVLNMLKGINTDENKKIQERLINDLKKSLNSKRQNKVNTTENPVQGNFVLIIIVLLVILFLLYYLLGRGEPQHAMGQRMISYNQLRYGATSSKAIDDKKRVESSFTNWALGNSESIGTRVNCWELILYTAFQMREITKDDIYRLYTGSKHMDEGGGAMFSVMKALGWKPSGSLEEGRRQSTPQRGDFVAFYDGGSNVHAGFAITSTEIVQINRGTGWKERVETKTLRETVNHLDKRNHWKQVLILSFTPDWSRLKKNK